MNNTATELVRSFSEDPKKMGIDDFMRELLEFLRRYDRAQRENAARELKVRGGAERLEETARVGTWIMAYFQRRSSLCDRYSCDEELVLLYFPQRSDLRLIADQ